MRRTLVVALPALAAALLTACASPPAPPRTYVALLENADGSTGRVVYNSPRGDATLSRAREAVALDDPARSFTLDEAQLQRDAGAAMAAQPLPARSFVLYFEAGDTQINAASRALLPQILQEVQRRPVPELSIIGHTDTVGSSEQNSALALRRAELVAQLLQEAASAARHVETTSHGEHNLLVPTADETPEPRNRRVEVTVR